jgi:sirohydrochlorin ferrochelatase
MTNKAILIVGHGSRLAFNKMTIEYQAEILRGMGYDNVYIGFNETSFPTVEDTMVEMAADGVDEVVALPFFVASGLHMVRDIPPKLGLKEGQSEGEVDIDGKRMVMHFETPFGEDGNLTDILDEKIREIPENGKKRGIIVMGHGSRLPYNSQIMEYHAQRLRNLGYSDVRIGYNEFNDPKIDDVLAEMVEDGVEEVVALPLFIASGAHLSHDIPFRLGIPEKTDSATATFNGKDIDVKYATPIGGDPRLCKVLDAKIRKYYGE